jgi:hypothetical protein
MGGTRGCLDRPFFVGSIWQLKRNDMRARFQLIEWKFCVNTAVTLTDASVTQVIALEFVFDGAKEMPVNQHPDVKNLTGITGVHAPTLDGPLCQILNGRAMGFNPLRCAFFENPMSKIMGQRINLCRMHVWIGIQIGAP